MAPSRKVLRGLSKSSLAEAVAAACGLKRKDAMKALDVIAEVGANEVKNAGAFTLPGVFRIKTKVKAATKAGQREIFGKICVVKARPARTVVKAFPVSTLKKEF
mmetsp:Transcript_49423/g.147609  ORF Transcript_49423/g.147609 Transcript_49423/m.147609 type:complete len:104 (-) Transcript_49423:13-324(-)